MISVKATNRRHDDAATKGKLRFHLPFYISLLDVDLARTEFVLNLSVENNILLLCQHRRDSEDETSVLKVRRSTSIGALADRRLAKLKISIAPDGDSVSA